MDNEKKAPEEEKDKKPVEETADKPDTKTAEQPAPDDKQADDNSSSSLTVWGAGFIDNAWAVGYN